MLIVGGNQSAGGYEVDNSLRFNDGSSDHLERIISTNGNLKTFTFSCWVKRSNLTGSNQTILSAYKNTGSQIFYTKLIFDSSERLHFMNYPDAYSIRTWIITNQVFRDVSGWYHIVVASDSTQATASNRTKIYVNGEQVTSFSEETQPSLNRDYYWNNTVTSPMQIGRDEVGRYFDGYMSEVVFIDGSQLDPTSFGEFDSDSGIWKPIDVSGLTFGSAGFYLPFENSAALGQDDSGNGNNFTVNNLTSIDQTTDTPTNNSATMNPLAPANISSNSDGNLNILQSSSGGSVISTFGFSSGKWYWEVEIDSQVTYTQLAGVIKESKMESAALSSFNVGANDGGWGYFLQSNADNGKAFHNNSVSSVYTTVSNGDILNIAVDSDNGKIFFGVNGTYVNSGDPASGTGAVYTNLPTGENLFPAITNYVGSGTTATILMNFGNPPFTISSGNSDGNGYGNFEYAVPSGYYALNTKNLAEYG